jgi:hypothetical protein
MPTTKLRLTAATAMPRSSRVATIVRLKMSRPSASVPNQCAALFAVFVLLVLFGPWIVPYDPLASDSGS